MTAKSLSLCVYCGSRSGTRPEYLDLAARLGRSIGQRGWELVYGGGRVGLMGAVADAVLAHGGRVVGVIPESLMRPEIGHGGLDELHVVQTMHQRKQLMAERSHAFLAMPGGIGTFEELFEVWTWRHLDYHDRPIGLLDCADYWRPLIGFLEHACREGFMDGEQMAMLRVDADIDRLLDTLAASVSPEHVERFERI